MRNRGSLAVRNVAAAMRNNEAVRKTQDEIMEYLAWAACPYTSRTALRLMSQALEQIKTLSEGAFAGQDGSYACAVFAGEERGKGKG